MLPELPFDRLGILVGNQPETELRPRLAREHRLGPGSGITAENAVDIAGRPGPLPLERGVSLLALQGRHAQIGLKLGLGEGQPGEFGRVPILSSGLTAS